MNPPHRTELKDDYEHPDNRVEYIIENVLFEPPPNTQQSTEYENLFDEFNSLLLNACSCSGACDNHTTCLHGGNYIPSAGELVLNPGRCTKDLIYECSDKCKCRASICKNRLVQYGPRANLEIIASKVLPKQYALRTNAPIPRGGFVCEYAGEIITRSEAHRRVREELDGGTSESIKMNYVLCLNECSLEDGSASSVSTFVDPRRRGNVGRYLNHSCQPNCEILSVRVDCPVPKIGIFAKQDIATGGELCFHYGGSAKRRKRDAVADANAIRVGKPTPCLCGSLNCEKILPNLEF